MTLQSASEKIISAALTWEGVTTHPHRFGGTEFRLGKRELGHIHGNGLLDVPFPLNIRNELVAAGRVQPHHVLPKSGWVSFYIRETSDVEKGIELLRLSYEIASKR
ncbi:MAG: DUF5519 family protein [Ignavibacteriales bacterium]|nr:DUF5519 family protein [Ignavibacteriales bacterium]MBI3787769.1 DUF5519 family protein [Ignavibacteriales bacterium]